MGRLGIDEQERERDTNIEWLLNFDMKIPASKSPAPCFQYYVTLSASLFFFLSLSLFNVYVLRFGNLDEKKNTTFFFRVLFCFHDNYR